VAENNSGCGTGGCCCDRCLAAFDHFKRADNAFLGQMWDVRSPAIVVASESATTSDSNALAINREPSRLINDAGPGPNGAVYVTVAADTIGDQAIAVIGYEDDDNYNYCRYEFGDGESYASLWARIGGTNTLLRGPYTICDWPHDRAVRIKLCLTNFTTSLNFYLIDPETGLEFFKGRAIDPPVLGNFAGFGTRIVTGELVFDDWELRRTSFTHSQHGCPDCEVCPFCPDQQVICSRLDGFGVSLDGDVQMVRASSGYDDGNDDGGGGAPSLFDPHSNNCGWGGDGTNPANPPLASRARVYIQKATDGNYYLWGLIDLSGIGGFCGWIYRKNLGPCPPACDAWTCIELEFFDYLPCPAEDPETLPEEPYPVWTVSSGDACCYYSTESVCCEGDTLPATISVTLRKNGSVHRTYTLLLCFASDPSFRGDNFMYRKLCDPSDPDPGPGALTPYLKCAKLQTPDGTQLRWTSDDDDPDGGPWIILNCTSPAASSCYVDLTCSPFSAYGRNIGAHVWEVEVTE
jgi:hypothetical protein